MKNFKHLCFYILGVSMFSCAEANSQVKNLSLDDFVIAYQSTENSQLLDVRTAGEWSNGILVKSEKVDFKDAQFTENINKLDKSKIYFVYCAAGGRSARAAKVLLENGFKVYNLIGAGYGQLASKEMGE
ncbi:MAG: rhodanese-related sulfurtransferase [Algoriphagus sp.]|jgi:rhodanese-related sulfurtransferase